MVEEKPWLFKPGETVYTSGPDCFSKKYKVVKDLGMPSQIQSPFARRYEVRNLSGSCKKSVCELSRYAEEGRIVISV